jgi:hypothetical protein
MPWISLVAITARNWGTQEYSSTTNYTLRLYMSISKKPCFPHRHAFRTTNIKGRSSSTDEQYYWYMDTSIPLSVSSLRRSIDFCVAVHRLRRGIRWAQDERRQLVRVVGWYAPCWYLRVESSACRSTSPGSQLTNRPMFRSGPEHSSTAARNLRATCAQAAGITNTVLIWQCLISTTTTT